MIGSMVVQLKKSESESLIAQGINKRSLTTLTPCITLVFKPRTLTTTPSRPLQHGESSTPTANAALTTSTSEPFVGDGPSAALVIILPSASLRGLRVLDICECRGKDSQPCYNAERYGRAVYLRKD